MLQLQPQVLQRQPQQRQPQVLQRQPQVLRRQPQEQPQVLQQPVGFRWGISRGPAEAEASATGGIPLASEMRSGAAGRRYPNAPAQGGSCKPSGRAATALWKHMPQVGLWLCRAKDLPQMQHQPLPLVVVTAAAAAWGCAARGSTMTVIFRGLAMTVTGGVGPWG